MGNEIGIVPIADQSGLPFQKMLALFVVGHITVTTPLIEKCQRFGVALVVVKPSLRSVFFWSNTAEANFLLRQRQYGMDKEDLSIARVLITNKIKNQSQTLSDTRKKDELTLSAIERCDDCASLAAIATEYSELMGLEGLASRTFFEAYYQDLGWEMRRPRTKCDALNATLDIGYTILFNFTECFRWKAVRVVLSIMQRKGSMMSQTKDFRLNHIQWNTPT